MSQLTFYTNPQSRGRTVQWMLNECAADYKTHIIEYEHIKSPDYLAINPMGKLPALVTQTSDNQQVVVTEVVAICTYLADSHPQANLAPSIDSPERGRYYRWLFSACNVLEPAMMVQFGLLSRQDSDQANRALGFGSFNEALSVLEQELTDKDYLCDDTFSTADLYIASMIHWAVSQGAVETLPEHVSAYVQRAVQRQAFIDMNQHTA